VRIPLAACLALVVAGGLAARAGGEPRVLADLPATSNQLIGGARAQNSPVLAADPRDGRFVALANRWDAPRFNCALQLSGDGGRGWVPAPPLPELPQGVDSCYAPEIAFDAGGRLYMAFLGLAGQGNLPVGGYLTYSDDGGRSFAEPRRVLPALSFQLRLAIDPSVGARGRIYLMWLQARTDVPTGGLPSVDNPILLAHSDDGGVTFSPPVRVSDQDRPRALAGALSLGPKGELEVVYYDLLDDVRDYQGLKGPRWRGEWELVSTRSSDHGRSFSEGVAVARVVPPERVLLIYTMPAPALAVGPDGTVYTAWTDRRAGNPDVYLARRRVGGSWSAPLRLNDDGSNTQYLPALDVAPGGRVDALFLDRRDDPHDILNHTYYTYSHDGGASFVPNLRLSSRPSDSRVGQGYLVPSARGRQDIGSRLALLSSDGRALAAWPDTSNAPFSPYQDIFTTAVVFPSVTAPPWPWLAAAVLTFGVALVGLILRRSVRR
jgi:hypothetical protein